MTTIEITTGIQIDLDGPLAPRVLVSGDVSEEAIEAALPAHLTVGDNWSNGVKVAAGLWAYPLVLRRPDRTTVMALLRGAERAGDAEQVAICRRALDGDTDALDECASVIDNARAANV